MKNSYVWTEKKMRAGWPLLLVVGLVALAMLPWLPAALVYVAIGVGTLMIAWALVPETKHTCSACRNPVAGREVRVCPSCQAALGHRT